MSVRAWRRRKPTLLCFLDKIWTIFKNRKFPRHKPLKNHMEAYRCWCAAWTSNPVIAANPRDGGFDSHTLPPLSSQGVRGFSSPSLHLQGTPPKYHLRVGPVKK